MILAILQARCSSSRLPQKVLKPILGKPMLQRQIERLTRIKNFDVLTVATSQQSDDTPIEDLCLSQKIKCFRGSLNDVLDRFYQCAQIYQPSYIVRLTGDCPLTDPHLIEKMIDFALKHQLDYCSNSLKPYFPHGLDVEVFRFQSLKTAWHHAALPSEREHVTPYIWKNTQRFNVANFIQKKNLSFYRWTVDEPEDFELVNQIYQELYPKNPAFSTQEIINLLNQKPELLKINHHFSRNEGYLKSLQADKNQHSVHKRASQR